MAHRNKPLRIGCAAGCRAWRRYDGIDDPEEMRAHFRMNCLPESILEGEVPPYEEFLVKRRELMAEKIRCWFAGL